MPENNQLFLPLKDLCRRKVVTCSAQDSLVDVARLMRDKGISSVVVVDGETPSGIVTDRDLRSKVVAEGKSPSGLRVADVMNAPLITVKEEDVLFEALYLMSHHSIHRVAVTDSRGRLRGIITHTDILNLQAHSPHKLVRDIEGAQSVAQLKEMHQRIQALVMHLSGTGTRISELMRLIAHLNDQVLVRLIELLRHERFPNLPKGFAFVVLGSEGRKEQTLSTDQDNALILADELDNDDIRQLEEFSQELIDALIAIGVPSCPGGIMAKNAVWRRSFSEWREVLDRWLATPSPENILNGGMFFDLRTIYGDASLERRLKNHLAGRLPQQTSFLMRMADNTLGFRPPLGWFGRIKVEHKGEQRGLLDVKKAGIFSITDGIKVLALEAGILDGGTRERAEALVKIRVLSAKQAEDLRESFNFLSLMRLRGQVQSIKQGQKPSNYIAMEQLNHMERGRLRLALEEVESFQKFLRRHFRLELLLK